MLDDNPQRLEERRLVTVMFADVAGFTGLAERMDAEDVRDLLNALFAELVPLVERFAGTVDSFIGDCLLAIFGAPVSNDNDAERAVSAALEIPRSICSLNTARALDLSLHVGINTGIVVAGGLGAGAHRVYSVIGDAVNIASRLCGASLPGEILIGAATERLVRDRFQLEAAGHTIVRGRAEPVCFYHVLGRRPATPSSAANPSGSSFVGREREMGSMQSAVDALVGGTGGTVVVTGPPGVGKTRMINEVRRYAALLGVKWVESRAPAFGLDSSHSLLRALLESDMGMEPDEEPDLRRQKVAARTNQLFGNNGVEVRSWLDEVLGLRTSPQAETDHDVIDVATPDASGLLSRYLSSAAHAEPLLVCLDDVHWLEPSSLRLLQEILPLAASQPILFIMVGRPDSKSGCDEMRELTSQQCLAGRILEIDVGPLTCAETRALLRQLLNLDDVPLALEQMIRTKAEGNPFFTEEIVRHLGEIGAVRKDPDGRYCLTGDPAELQIPDTVRGVIAARVDRLDVGTKRHLREASVMGRTFSSHLLAVASGETTDSVINRLAELERLEFIGAGKRGSNPDYFFRHALIQEVVYYSILARSRRQMHQRVGELAERLRPYPTEQLDALLAYHFSTSEDWARAQRYLIKAGDHAMRISAGSDALTFYELALRAALGAFDSDWEIRPQDAADWFLERLEPFWQLRRLGRLLDPALRFAEKVSSVCGPTNPCALAAQGIVAACCLDGRSYARATTVLEKALALLDTRGEGSGPVQARLLLLLGHSYQYQDQLGRAEKTLRQALTVAQSLEQHSRLSLLPSIYVQLSSALYLSGRVLEDHQLIDEALQQPDVRESAQAWELRLNLSSTLTAIGHWDESISLAEKCLSELRNPYLRAYAHLFLGQGLRAQGALHEAERELLSSAARFEDLGKPLELTEAIRDLIETQLLLRKTAAAEQWAERGMSLLADVGNSCHSEQAIMLHATAGVEMANGNLDRAQELLQQSSLRARQCFAHLHPFRAELLFRTAELHLQRGRPEAADRYLRRATCVYQKLGGPSHPRILQMEVLRWRISGETGTK